MAHTQTPSDEQLADGNVITFLVMGVPRVFAYGRGEAFAAVKGYGSVVTWGRKTDGGNSDAVRSQLTTGVRHIVGSRYAFAAVKEDGSVVTWGMKGFGGDSDTVKSDLQCGVLQVVGTSLAFAAIKEDGSIVTWGRQDYGGNSDAVRSHLTTGVRHVVGDGYAFAAVKEDGSVVTWGARKVEMILTRSGADSPAVWSTLSAMALPSPQSKKDGSVVTWRCPESGGDSGAVQCKL